MKNIGVLVSGGGTNLQALIDAIDKGLIQKGIIKTVVSSRDGVYALERAKKHNINTQVILRKNYNNSDDYSKAIAEHMKHQKVDLIVMAGFLSIVSEKLINEYEHRIINIHPSLIPSFCGSGYYGLKVHEAALNRGVKITGATVHFVNNIPDGGPIIIQKAVMVQDNDTAESLQKRVMEEAEWIILPEVVSLFCNNQLEVVNDKVIVKR